MKKKKRTFYIALITTEKVYGIIFLAPNTLHEPSCLMDDYLIVFAVNLSFRFALDLNPTCPIYPPVVKARKMKAKK
jgi:hypothetical protein